MGSYGPVRSDPHAIGRRIREVCRQYGIADRMPRPIIPGDKRALNKRIVEALANQVYAMELDNAPGHRVWAYRKAAWAIEDLEQDVGLVYRQMGRKGLERIENVGPRPALVVEALIQQPVQDFIALAGGGSLRSKPGTRWGQCPPWGPGAAPRKSGPPIRRTRSSLHAA